MSTTLEAGGWAVKLAMAIATGTVIGGGSMVLNLHRNDAVQDEKIVTVAKTVEKIDRLDDKLSTTLRQVDLLNARLELEDRRNVQSNQ